VPVPVGMGVEDGGRLSHGGGVGGVSGSGSGVGGMVGVGIGGGGVSSIPMNQFMTWPGPAALLGKLQPYSYGGVPVSCYGSVQFGGFVSGQRYVQDGGNGGHHMLGRVPYHHPHPHHIPYGPAPTASPYSTPHQNPYAPHPYSTSPTYHHQHHHQPTFHNVTNTPHHHPHEPPTYIAPTLLSTSSTSYTSVFHPLPHLSSSSSPTFDRTEFTMTSETPTPRNTPPSMIIRKALVGFGELGASEFGWGCGALLGRGVDEGEMEDLMRFVR
ncbi:hypothetical protein HK097_009504, partial [Rhizophlyctis rosea]